MKRIDDLTKNQRTEWLNKSGVYRLGKLVEDASEVKYIVLENSKAEISEWLKNATTTYFDKSCAPYFCSVWVFNALNEYLNSPAKYIVRMSGMSQKRFADRFGIPLRTVEDWCAGKRQPPEYVLTMACEILNIAYTAGE